MYLSDIFNKLMNCYKNTSIKLIDDYHKTNKRIKNHPIHSIEADYNIS